MQYAFLSHMEAWPANVMPPVGSQTAREPGGVTVLWQSLLQLGKLVTRPAQEAERPVAARDKVASV